MGILSTLFSRRTCSLSPKTLRRPTSSQPDPIPQSRPTKKPLHALFSEAVGLSPKPTPSSDDHKEEEISSKLKQLEQEIKTKTEEFTLLTQKKMTLFAAFANKPKTKTHLKPKDPMPLSAKNLYPDILKFTHLLFDKGYFNDANFVMGRTQFDPDWFTHDFAVGYIKFAAVRFAKDNQEIAKWLSGSALKQVAMFGCPSTRKDVVFPAKSLRKFFEVPENTVCSGCSLQQSCKFANKSVWNCDINKLDLVAVMKILTQYALEIQKPQLVVPDEVKKSVSQLLKEVVKLSQTT